jgi:hypothetical protein
MVVAENMNCRRLQRPDGSHHCGEPAMKLIRLEPRDGFSGEVAVDSGPGGAAGRTYLRTARLVGAAGTAELGERNGNAFLSFPIKGGTVTFEGAAAIVRRGAHEQRHAFDNAEAVKQLGSELRHDAVYTESSSHFMRSAFERLADLERTGQVHGLLPAGLRGNPHKPGSGAWGGIDVFSFVDCLEDCMNEDHWLSTCLLLCGVKAATGGGQLFPEKK